MNTEGEVLAILDETLSLQGRAANFTGDTPLLGSLAEFDSMAVMTVITSIEERFDVTVDDDELDAQVFETVGSLTRFVETKLADA
ncbi:acyl carrier protein [Lentisalinibacter salinarum]|uniref:acyl carrier protein n=1 Tax=Lentisalinibacter salinarum TaxID=2992239 RepID=UPI003868B2D1